MTNENIERAFIAIGSLNGYLSALDGKNIIKREDFAIAMEWMQIVRGVLHEAAHIIRTDNLKNYETQKEEK
jgi:hypothetical protein